MTPKLNPDSKFIKFLYSYSGKIVPRSSDGKLRYAGGYTRVLAVDCSITYSELMAKFVESCGSSVSLKCKLPNEDLDVLISIKSDEDLRSLVDEYESRAPESKIRAVLFPITTLNKVSRPSSPMSCFDFPSVPKPPRVIPSSSVAFYRLSRPTASVCQCLSPEVGYPVAAGKYNWREARNPNPNPNPKYIRSVLQHNDSK